jgi:hypothetical protein
MSTEKVQTKNDKFVCLVCDYNTCRKSQYDRHLTTSKHISSTKSSFFVPLNNCLDSTTNKSLYGNTNKRIEPIMFTCQYCQKEYKERTGLWRHNKKCVGFEVTKQKDDLMNLTNVVSELVKSNIELHKHNDDLQRQTKEFQSSVMTSFTNVINNNQTIISNNIINSNNKTSFNLHFFLNEKCKNAANLSDFMNSIQLNLSDLENVGKVGYVDGISNIIINKLKEMDVYSRPIHCSDTKREVIYIKENDVWTKEDNENKRLRTSIKEISFRNCKNFFMFKEKYPDCVKCESTMSDQYMKIVSEAIGGKGACDMNLNENKIIKKIAREMYIDKSNYISLGF